MKRYMLILMTCISIYFHTHGQLNEIQTKINHLVEDKELVLGFALQDLRSGDTLSINGERRFPMQSVFKIPVALTVLDNVDKKIFQLNQMIYVSRDDVKTEMWSPLAKKHPNGNVSIPLLEIIRYTVAQSDNVGCDLLLTLLGGTSHVQSYLIDKNITDISIKYTEREMQSSWTAQFENWSTPKAMINLLTKMDNKSLLMNDTNELIWKIMSESSTGSIRNKLPKDTYVAYKTGTSGYNKNISAATNCVGVLSLPNNKKIAFAIFITASKESSKVNADIIADIAKLLFSLH